MTDKTDPRLEVLQGQWLEWANLLEGPERWKRLLADFDAAEHAAGVVRVDTRDEALVERLAQAMYDGLSEAPNGWPPEETAVRAVLAALREAS